MNAQKKAAANTSATLALLGATMDSSIATITPPTKCLTKYSAVKIAEVVEALADAELPHRAVRVALGAWKD